MNMFMVILISFVAGMIAMELVVRFTTRKTAGAFHPTPPQSLPSGVAPAPPSAVSTGSAVSTVRLFERQNEMDLDIHDMKIRISAIESKLGWG